MIQKLPLLHGRIGGFMVKSFIQQWPSFLLIRSWFLISTTLAVANCSERVVEVFTFATSPATFWGTRIWPAWSLRESIQGEHQTIAAMLARQNYNGWGRTYRRRPNGSTFLHVASGSKSKVNIVAFGANPIPFR